jgi:hypothetical protein
MNFERAFTVVSGIESATALAGRLLLASAFYEMTPLPGDEYQFAVKVDRKDLLDGPDFDGMGKSALGDWYKNVVGYSPVEDDPAISLEELRANCKEMALIERCGGIDTPAYQQIEAQRRAAIKA